MSHFTTYPMIRLMLIWITGITIALYAPLPLTFALLGTGILLLCYITYFTLLKVKFKQPNWISCNCIGLILSFFLSYSHTLMHIRLDPKNNFGILENKHTIEGYQVHIDKVYTTQHTYISHATIRHIRNHLGWYRSIGQVKLYFTKKCNYQPEVGHILLIRGSPQQLPFSQTEETPFTHQVVCFQKFKNSHDFVLLPPTNPWSMTIRQKLKKIIKQPIQDKVTISVINALLFGEKDQLDTTLGKSYMDTGTIHLLVVSGLHVGMLYHIIDSIIKFFKIGHHLFKEMVTLILIWLYAWLCGFTPPILRATTTLTLTKIGWMIGRTTNTHYTLFTSAFLLLVWNPLLLCNCSFQLSYLATIGIHYLHPPLKACIKHHWLKKIWHITTLSIAAQISSFPLILYYFKSFPTYFIIANWLAIPAMFILLILSFMLIGTTYFPFLAVAISFLLTKLVFITNQWICWIAQWPWSTLHPLTISKHTVYLLYSIMVATYLFFQNKHFIYPTIITLGTACFSVMQISSMLKERSQFKITFYNDHNDAFTIQDDTTTITYHDQKPTYKTPLLQPYAGGVMAIWHKKVIFWVKTIPMDWYRWKEPKLLVDYLCITQDLLKDRDVLTRVFQCGTWIIYSYASARPPSFLFKASNTSWIWLSPGKQKTFIGTTAHTKSS